MTRRLLFHLLLHQCVGEGAPPFQALLHFTLDTYILMLSVKLGSIKYYFWVFSMTRPGIEPRSPGQLAKPLLIRSILSLITLEFPELIHISNSSVQYFLCSVGKFIPNCYFLIETLNISIRVGLFFKENNKLKLVRCRNWSELFDFIFDWLNYWLICFNGMSNYQGFFFMPRGYGFPFLVQYWLHFYVLRFLNIFVQSQWYKVFLSNTNNVQTLLLFWVFLSNINYH